MTLGKQHSQHLVVDNVKLQTGHELSTSSSNLEVTQMAFGQNHDTA